MNQNVCPRCSSVVIKGNNFCQCCGFKLDPEFIECPICPKCNKKFPSGSKYCQIDGSKLISADIIHYKCVKCGSEYSFETKFCPNDGGVINPEMQNNTITNHHLSSNFKININYSKASLSSRFLANFIDSWFYMILLIPAAKYDEIVLLDRSNNNQDSFLYLIGYFLYLIPVAYSIIKDGFGNGQSWGKKQLDLW